MDREVPTPGRVLIVSHEASRTGAPKVARDLLAAHLEAGWDARLLYRWGGPLVDDFTRTGPTLGEPLRRLRVLLRRYRPTKPLARRLEGAVARRVLRRWRPDVVWCNTTLSAVYAVAADQLDVPAVLYSHEAETLARAALERVGLAGAGGVGRSSAVLVGCATATAHELAALMGRDPMTARVLQSPTDVADVQRRGAAGSRVVPGRYVLGCGRPNRTKGIDVFCEAAAIGAGSGRRWVWLGGDVGELDHPAVTHLPQLPDPAPVMAHADALVLTSRTDPFPLVVLEAMALGVPVICTDLAGPREQLGELGVFVPLEDAPGFAAAVDALPTGAAARAAVEERLRGRCRDHWDIAVFAERSVALSQEVLGAAATGSPDGAR